MAKTKMAKTKRERGPVCCKSPKPPKLSIFSFDSMSLSKANAKCRVCNRDGVKARPHPSFSDGGALGALGSQLACLLCMQRLGGKWPLKKGEDGEEKHGWCLACGCETDKIAEMTQQLCVTEHELKILEEHGQLDNEGAALYVCDEAKCKVAMCAVCLYRLFGSKAMLDADQAGHWGCPICTGMAVASQPAVAAALAPPAPPAPAPPAPAPAPPAEPAVKKARLDEPTGAGGSGLSSSSSSSGSGDGSGSGSSSDSDEAA